MNRFSKMVSSITLRPRAVTIRTMLSLHVGREAGVRRGLDVHRLQRPIGDDPDAFALALHDAARFAHLGGDRLEVVEGYPPQQDVAAGRRRRRHVGSGLDAVGDDGVVHRPEHLPALDDDDVGTGALDAGPHLVEHPGELLDLRLARGVDQRGPALGEDRGAHQVLGAGHRRHVEDDLGADPPAPGYGRNRGRGRPWRPSPPGPRGAGRWAGRRWRSPPGARPSLRHSEPPGARARAPRPASS